MKHNLTSGNKDKEQLMPPKCDFNEYIWAVTALLLKQAVPVSRLYQISLDYVDDFTQAGDAFSVELILNKENWILTFEGDELILNLLDSNPYLGNYLGFFPNTASAEARYTNKIVNKQALILTMEIEYNPGDRSDLIKAILTKKESL